MLLKAGLSKFSGCEGEYICYLNDSSVSPSRLDTESRLGLLATLISEPSMHANSYIHIPLVSQTLPEHRCSSQFSLEQIIEEIKIHHCDASENRKLKRMIVRTRSRRFVGTRMYSYLTRQKNVALQQLRFLVI